MAPVLRTFTPLEVCWNISGHTSSVYVNLRKGVSMFLCSGHFLAKFPAHLLLIRSFLHPHNNTVYMYTHMAKLTFAHCCTCQEPLSCIPHWPKLAKPPHRTNVPKLIFYSRYFISYFLVRFQRSLRIQKATKRVCIFGNAALVQWHNFWNLQNFRNNISSLALSSYFFW